MDIEPDQPIEIMVDEATGAKFRICRTCKRFNIPLLDPRRTCSKCRQHRNESSKKAREKSRVKVREAELAAGQLGQKSSSPNLSNSTSTRVDPPPPKRKAEQTIPNLEGEPHRKKVAKTIRVTAKMMLLPDVTNQKESSNKEPAQYTEYQSASSLYEAAKNASSAGGRFNFLGCHSIVRCDDINHRKRANLVTRDLRTIVKLSFKYDVPYSNVESKIKYLLKYRCNCSKAMVVSGSSKPSTKKSKDNGNFDHSCGGFVTITVQDDDSHFLGITGQQIMVQIQH